MPQVLVTLSPYAQNYIGHEGSEVLSKGMTKAVEEVFELEGLDDVAFSVTHLAFSVNEADVQVTVRYTAGKDEYNQGEPFNPTEMRRELLASRLKQVVSDLINRVAQDRRLVISVWIIPIYKSIFLLDADSNRVKSE